MNKNLYEKEIKKESFCCNYDDDGGGDMRVHSHVEPGRGRFRRVAFFDLFSSCSVHSPPRYTTNITITAITTTTSPHTHIFVLIQVDDEEGREEQRKTQHRYYSCALCPYTNVCAFFLSTEQRRNTNVYMMNISFFSLSLSPNSRSMMMMMMMMVMMMTIEI